MMRGIAEKLTRRGWKFWFSKLLSLATLLIILAFYWLNQTQAIWQNQYPQGDEAAYLATAIEIKEEGGALNLIPRMFSGDYIESNRHPFYVGILSIFAEPSLDFFAQGKIFNLYLGLCYLVLLYLIMRKLLNDFLSLLIILLFSLNYFFLNQLSKVSTEPLFFLMFLLSWYLIVTLKKPEGRQLILAGGVTALSYLAKVTGIFLMGSYFLTSLTFSLRNLGRPWRWGDNKLTWVAKTIRPLFLFLIAFVVVALPLLWRNVLVYQNPFHNYNSKLLFISTGEERRSLDLYAGSANGVSDLLNNNSLSEVVTRFLKGMLSESVVLSQLVFFDYGRIRGAILVIVLLAVGLIQDKNRWRSIFSFLLISMFFVFFSWYFTISGHFRYVLPILFLIYFYLFKVLMDLYEKFIGSRLSLEKLKWLPSLGLFLLSLGVLIIETQQHDFVTPAYAYRVSKPYLEVRNWLISNISNDTLFMNGPGHDFQVEWLTGTTDRSLEMPFVENMFELNKFIQDYKIKYVILSPPTVKGREMILKDYFEVKGEGIVEKKVPPGWVLVKTEEQSEKRYLIYEVNLEE